MESWLGMGGRASRPPATGRGAGERLSPQHGSSGTIRSRRSSRHRRVGGPGGRALVVAPSGRRSAWTCIVAGSDGRLKAMSRVRPGVAGVRSAELAAFFYRAKGEERQVASTVQRWIASMRSAGEQGFVR